MATKLLEKVKMQEHQESKERSTVVKSDGDSGSAKKHRAVNQISSKDGSKDKQISAKVNGNVYALFTEINRAQGISNNSALNMILTKYVRENKGLLDE